MTRGNRGNQADPSTACLRPQSLDLHMKVIIPSVSGPSSAVMRRQNFFGGGDGTDPWAGNISSVVFFQFRCGDILLSKTNLHEWKMLSEGDLNMSVSTVVSLHGVVSVVYYWLSLCWASFTLPEPRL